ncbi:hypothetical protein F4821DRAFT_207520 [Hypoxylon rubiginosum]|uniref:Uncharacterized protein n=1 Tax=Hypoxylon rubiginosum TaxID=110542 RepID=A0ACC0CQM0_9PEZI|nr:hypothetical protein F4821DRAFT_207520 [Hypoxylon rubiginosum]
MVVAMSPGQSGHCGQSINIHYHGKWINIHYSGKSASTKIVDTCPGCGGDGIDVSLATSKKFAELCSFGGVSHQM